jgi:hypothetical protein
LLLQAKKRDSDLVGSAIAPIDRRARRFLQVLPRTVPLLWQSLPSASRDTPARANPRGRSGAASAREGSSDRGTRALVRNPPARGASSRYRPPSRSHRF